VSGLVGSHTRLPVQSITGRDSGFQLPYAARGYRGQSP